jgi:ATP-dependent Clp protease ATP-binding subunit ClpA
MMFEQFTRPARAAVAAAQEVAREFQHSEITAGHLLLGLLADDRQVAAVVVDQLRVDRAALRAAIAAYDSPDAEALRILGIDLEQVRRQAEQAFGPGALDRPRRQRRGLFGHRRVGGNGFVPFDVEAKAALEGALREALARHDRHIGTEHLLLGLLTTRSGSVIALLRRLGVVVDLEAIRGLIDQELGRAA